MGTDKALLPFRGRPLVEHALGILREAGLSASIAGSRSPLEAFAAVLDDAEADQGPLGGICAAMGSTGAQWAVFLPVDLPLLPSSLISHLVRHAEISAAPITLARAGAFTQTFPAVLNRAALPFLQKELAADRLGCFQALESAAASLGQQLSVIVVEDVVAAGDLRDASK